MTTDHPTNWTVNPSYPQAGEDINRAVAAGERELAKPFDWTLKAARRRHEINQRAKAGREGRN